MLNVGLQVSYTSWLKVVERKGGKPVCGPGARAVMWYDGLAAVKSTIERERTGMERVSRGQTGNKKLIGY